MSKVKVEGIGERGVYSFLSASVTIASMKKPRLTSESVVLALVVIAILWRGGKALDVVWLQALVAGAVTLFSLTGREEAVPIPKLFGFLLVSFTGWTLVSFIFSQTQNYGFDELMQTMSLALLSVWAASEAQRNQLFPARLSTVISGATLIACGVGIVIYVLQPVNRFTGTFFDYRFHTDYWPNAWAEFLLLAWPVLFWTLFVRPVRRMPDMLNRDWVKSILLGVTFGSLLLSFSRGSMLALAGQFVLLAVLVFILYKPKRFFARTLITTALVAIVACATFLTANHLRSQFHAVESLEKKVTFSSAEGASSISERKQFWMQSLMLASERPLFGYGPYSFRFVQPHVQTEILATSDHPHNVFLKLASERGIIAAVLFLAILLFVTVAFFMSAKNNANLSLHVFFLVSIAGVIAHNLIDYNLQFVGIALPLWLMIGCLVSMKPKKKVRWFRVTLILLSALLLFVSFYEGIHLYLSSRARHADAEGQSYEALRWYSWVDSSLFPRDARLAQAAILKSLNQMPQAEDAVNNYLFSNAEDGRAWRLLGDVYLQWNKRNDGLRAYDKAYQLSRFNDAGILRGLVYLQEDVDREVLLQRRPEIDTLINAFALAIQQNTHFIDLSSNVEDIVAVCDLMARFFPADSMLYRSLARFSMEHATLERSRMDGKPKGMLW